MSIIGTLLEQRQVRLIRRATSASADDVEAIGWYDEDFAYLLPEAARRRVATFLREAGEAWSHSAHALNKALVRKGIVLPGPDARPEMQVRVGDGKRRVLRIRLTPFAAPTSPIRPHRRPRIPPKPGAPPLTEFRWKIWTIPTWRLPHPRCPADPEGGTPGTRIRRVD